MRFEFNDGIKIGINEIDEQHKELIRIMNNFFDACASAKGNQVIVETLTALENYTVIHFKDEERFMRRCAYPELAQHEKLHQEFIDSVIKLKNKLKTTGITTSLVVETNNTIGNWLVNHIMDEDKKIAVFLNNR